MVHPFHEVLDRGTPDVLSTEGLPAVVAAEVDYLAGRPGCWTAPRPEVHWGVTARAMVQSGDHRGAREFLATRLAAAGARQDWTSQGLVAATWAVSRVGPTGALAHLEGPLRALPPGFVTDHGVPLAPTEQLHGLVHAARGELAAATEALSVAAVEGDRRAPLWGAVARLELARVLRCRELVDPPPDATRTELPRATTSARTFFAASGCVHLDRCAAELDGRPAAPDLAAPAVGHLIEGGEWTVGFGVAPPATTPASKGLVLIRHLVQRRHRPVPAVELDRLLDGRPTDVFDQLEPEALAQLLGADAGSGGADAPAAELRAVLFDDRARSRVSKLVRRTIDRLAAQHPLLVRHLSAAVSTGYACRYDADPAVDWIT